MKMKLVLVLVIVTTSLILTSCYFNLPGGCKGVVKVENPIPDTTMVVGQIIKINLIANPAVFQQTSDNGGFSYNVLNQNDSIVLPSLGNKTNNTLILQARGIGIDTLIIQAKDVCDSFANTTFVVTVKDSSIMLHSGPRS